MSIKEEIKKYEEMREKLDKAIIATSELRKALLEIGWKTKERDYRYEMFKLADLAYETILKINNIENYKSPWE